MATTIQRPKCQGDNAWDHVRFPADLAAARATSYLLGDYQFTLKNSTQWRVYINLRPEGESSNTRIGKEGFDIFIPPGKSVQVKTNSENHFVSALFYRTDRTVRIGNYIRDKYEQFWDKRPFTWEPGVVMEVLPRHADVKTNIWRSGVTFHGLEIPHDAWEDEAAAAKTGVAQEASFAKPPTATYRAAMPAEPASSHQAPPLPPLTTVLVPDKDKEGAWVGGSLTKEFADGSMEVRGDKGTFTVRPDDVFLTMAPPDPMDSFSAKGVPRSRDGPNAMLELGATPATQFYSMATGGPLWPLV